MKAALVAQRPNQSDPRIVIALTTCNGERFLPRLLASILHQSPLPDAMVVGDDASEDRTLEILERFRRTAPFPVTILRNTSRQGVHLNSDQAMGTAAQLGDVVAPVDHDDVWLQGRTAAIAAAFRRPETTLWFSEAELIDPEDRALGISLSQFVSLDEASIDELCAGGGLRRLTHGWTFTGGATAIRADVVELALPTPNLLVSHGPAFFPDGWQALVARIRGEFVADSRVLFQYRRHPGQLSDRSGDPVAPALSRRAAARMYRDDEMSKVGLIAARLREHPNVAWNPTRRDFILDLDHFLEVRALKFGTKGRSRAVAEQFRSGAYHRFARGVRTAASDLIHPR